MSQVKSGLPRLLVVASTYPRWIGDTEPGFVHELAKRLTDDFDVMVLAPCAPGAARAETMDGVEVRRYRYAPAALETLVNDGGMLTNLKRQPWKWLLVPGFLLAMLGSLWRQMRQWRPDVIHAHWLLPQGFAAALLACAGRGAPPFVVTSHGVDIFSLRSPLMRMAKRFVALRASAATGGQFGDAGGSGAPWRRQREGSCRADGRRSVQIPGGKQRGTITQRNPVRWPPGGEKRPSVPARRYAAHPRRMPCGHADGGRLGSRRIRLSPTREPTWYCRSGALPGSDAAVPLAGSIDARECFCRALCSRRQRRSGGARPGHG